MRVFLSIILDKQVFGKNVNLPITPFPGMGIQFPADAINNQYHLKVDYVKVIVNKSPKLVATVVRANKGMTEAEYERRILRDGNNMPSFSPVTLRIVEASKWQQGFDSEIPNKL